MAADALDEPCVNRLVVDKHPAGHC
jgi:hypothetical protein